MKFVETKMRGASPNGETAAATMMGNGLVTIRREFLYQDSVLKGGRKDSGPSFSRRK